MNSGVFDIDVKHAIKIIEGLLVKARSRAEKQVKKYDSLSNKFFKSEENPQEISKEILEITFLNGSIRENRWIQKNLVKILNIYEAYLRARHG